MSIWLPFASKTLQFQRVLPKAERVFTITFLSSTKTPSHFSPSTFFWIQLPAVGLPDINESVVIVVTTGWYVFRSTCSTALLQFALFLKTFIWVSLSNAAYFPVIRTLEPTTMFS